MFRLDGNNMHIPLPTDEEGYTGRECPQCERYFKLVFGTGLPDTTETICPYCGHKAEGNHFFTKDQIEYVQSVVYKYAVDRLAKGFKQIAQRRPKKSGFLSLEFTVKNQGKVRIAHYTEKDLETQLICSNCTLNYAVYGVYVFCPDCGQRNALQILLSNFEVIGKLLEIAETVHADVQEAIFESCLAKTVAAFDGYGREICEVYSHKSIDPGKAAKVRFQNISNARLQVQTLFAFDFTSALSASEWDAVIRLFQKRHLFAHSSGEIDDEYLLKANDPSAKKGHKITLQKEELITFMDQVGRIATNIDVQMKSLFGTLP